MITVSVKLYPHFKQFVLLQVRHSGSYRSQLTHLPAEGHVFQGQSQFPPFVLYPNRSHVSVQIPSEAMYFEKGA
mgnify:CR=1 FL=1